MITLSIVGGTDHTPETSQTEPRRDQTASGRISFRARDDAETLTTINRNKRLRKQRNDVWRKADAAVNYWRARIELEDAIEIGHREGIPETCFHPTKTHEYRPLSLKSYRLALAQQLLTPAPDAAAVNWKQAVVDRNDYVFVEYVEKEQIEKAIADDLAFLAAHPARRARSKRP
jgi:hypothetical protein